MAAPIPEFFGCRTNLSYSSGFFSSNSPLPSVEPSSMTMTSRWTPSIFCLRTSANNSMIVAYSLYAGTIILTVSMIQARVYTLNRLHVRFTPKADIHCGKRLACLVPEAGLTRALHFQ